jgi:hypothetical protein
LYFRRVQLLEAENKRVSNRKASDVGQSGDTLESLQDEIATLKKDMQTAERIAKQADVSF